MAIKIFEKFAPRANPADGDYPYGSIKNESVPGAKDGTPLDAEWGNDYAGFDAALFAEAGIVPNGNPDTVIESQRVDALRKIVQNFNYKNLKSVNSINRPIKERLGVVTYIGDFLVVNAVVNHTIDFGRALEAAAGGILDLESSTVKLDIINLPSNTIVRNGKIIFSAASTSSLDNPLITGTNFIRGINSEANYPINKLEKSHFHNVAFENEVESTTRKYVAMFYNSHDVGFYQCDFTRIFGAAIRFIGNHVGTTPNTTNYDIPVPLGYCTHPVVRHCTFEDALYHDGGGALQLGEAMRFVACKDIDAHKNKMKNCIAGILADFLNLRGKVTKNIYEITNPDIYANIANYQDVVAFYAGQATQGVDFEGNLSIGASRIGLYVEGASFNTSTNDKFYAWEGAVGDTGVFCVPAKLYPTAPELFCQQNEFIRTKVYGYETPMAIVSSTTVGGIDGGRVMSATLKKRALSTQPALVLAGVSDFKLSDVTGYGALQLGGSTNLSINDSSFNNDNNSALIIKSGTYINVQGSDNSFVTSEPNAVTAEAITGFLRFTEGFLQCTGDKLAGTFTGGLDFVNYSLGSSLSLNDVVNLTIPANSSAIFYRSISGTSFGDNVESSIPSDTFGSLQSEAVVLPDGTIFVKVSNVSSSAIGPVNVPLLLSVTKFSNSDFRK
jgi:hypothetical protein